MEAKAKLLTCALVLTTLMRGLGQQPPAAIQFSSPAYDVVEDAGTALITVLRTGDLNSVVTIDYATSDGTAKEVTDYFTQSGILRFAAGETNKTLSISILDDGLVEGEETVNVGLSSPTGGATLGLQSKALLTIRDNELRARLLDIAFKADMPGTSSSTFVLQDNGKIISGVTLYFSDGGPATTTIERLNPDGSFDTTFSFTMEQTGQVGYTALVLAAALEEKVLIGGAFKKVGAVSRAGIARLNKDGSLDMAFDPGLGPAGVLNQDTNARVEVITLQPDGKAVIGGVFSRFNGQLRSGLARLNVDGSLDTNFNARVNVSPGAILVLPDGKLLVGGGFTIVNGMNMTYIARLNADGTTDPSFQAKFAMGGSISSLALQPDGRILIAGGFSPSRTLERLNPDGTDDTNFVTGFSGVVFTVGLQRDGKIVISGSFSMVGGAPRSNVARLLPDGSVDQIFDFPLDNFPMTVVVQPDDDILFGGNFSVVEGINRSGMVRVHGHPERVHPIEFVSALYSVSEGTGAATISVQRAGDTTGSASVDYATSVGTATEGLDYIAQSGTLIFAPLEVTKAVTVPILADALVEGDETVNVRLSNPSSGAQLGEKTTATLTTHDDDKAPQFAANSFFVNENDGLAPITLRRAGDLKQSITLDYSTSDGTAVASKDYIPQKGVITFALGVTTQTIKIPILDNAVVDGPRTVQVTVSNSTIFPKPSTATLTISDNEQAVLFDLSFVLPRGTSGSGAEFCVQDLLVQPDGKVVIGGCFTNIGGLSRNGIARLNGDGSIDLSFDPGSGVSRDSGPAAVFALALQLDGKIIVSGSFYYVNGHVRLGLARLNPDGTLDGTFKAFVDAPRSFSYVRQVTVQADGKILFAGYLTDGRLVVGRLNADGSLDPTFHSENSLPPAPQDFVSALQPDGKIIAGGTFSVDGSAPNLIRLSADGSLDSSFTFVPPTALGARFSISAIALQPDGKILASASFYQANGISRNAIFRLHPDGSLDPTFNDASIQEIAARQILVQANGQVLVMGYPGGVRLDADGSLDRLFDLGSVSAVAIQPDGMIIAAGSFPGGVARIFPDVNQPGGPEFTASTFAFDETAGAAVLTVRRLGDTSRREMTVDFSTSDMTAQAGLDYVAQSGTLRFAPLQVTNAISITIINDGLVEEEKSFRVTLSNPSNDFSLQLSRTATVVITSNDTGIQFASDTFTVNEAAGFAEVLVTRSGDGLSAAAVDYSTSDGTATAGADYLARSGTITFASGETNKTIQIPILDDGLVEGDENIHLALSNPRAGAMLGARTNATLVIADNEINGPPAISFATASSSASESAGLAVITVQRSGDTGQASVHYATQDGTALANLNYLPTGGTLTFAPLENTKTVVIPILDDGLPSADTHLSLTLSNPSNGTTINAGLNTTTLTIADNQRPGSVDFSFNPLIETTNASPSGFHLALQPDGKVVVAGDFQRVNGVSRNGICRLNPDGSLDISFDPKGGLATLPDRFGNLGPVYSLALQSDGKILVRGSFDSVDGLNYTNFVRLNADGSVDTHFVPDAAAQVRSIYDRGGGMAVQPDGKILVAEAGDCCGIKPVKLGRLAADGSSDPTFVTLEVVGASSGWGSTFNVIVVEGNGSVLFEGNVGPATPNIVGPGQGLTRLNADGSIDESFHPVMDKLIDGDGGSRNTAVVQPDGKIVIAGLFNQVNGVDRPGLARLNPDGATDVSFVPESNDAGDHYSRPLALQADGKLLTGFGMGIVRLENDGSRDLSFDVGLDGIKQNGFAAGLSDIIVQPDGHILVAGNFTSVNGSPRSGLVRLNGDAGLANSRARFRSITGVGTGKVRLDMDVIPNRTYAIEASTDLINWTAIITRKATSYVLNVTDSAVGISQRYYRAVEIAP